MKVDIFTQAHWFRFIGRSPVELENSHGTKLILQGRAIYGVFQHKDKWYVAGEPSYEIEEYFPVKQGILELMLKSSKPFTGRLLGKSIEPGDVKMLEGAPVFDAPEPVAKAPKITGSKSVELVPLAENRLTKLGAIVTPNDRIFKMVTEASAMLGIKVPFKKSVQVAVSTQVPTCMMGIYNKIRGSYDTYIVINLGQLQSIFGRITAVNLAQVLTHELAHYIMDYKVMKQSDLIKFKKLIAAKAAHKDQFNHPGYSYAWWKEAWAILCEAMVHGRSVRGFSTELGYDIAQKYFVNRYLINGEYIGSRESM